MKRKMALLEQAHGLLCNVPQSGDFDETQQQWNKLRTEWIERWTHVIGDQQVKERNARTAVGNAAVEDYQRRCEPTSVMRLDRPDIVCTHPEEATA
jgi:hypothetical protein